MGRALAGRARGRSCTLHPPPLAARVQFSVNGRHYQVIKTLNIMIGACRGRADGGARRRRSLCRSHTPTPRADTPPLPPPAPPALQSSWSAG